MEWISEERKVGREPRKALTQAERLCETSKSFEARDAICRRRAWALGRGGRRGRRVDEAVLGADNVICCWER